MRSSSPASAASAIAWEFRRRHRWGLIALAAYLVILASIKLVFLGGGTFIFESDEKFALSSVAVIGTPPTSANFSSLTYGLSGDLAARESMYPARMFTLPVSAAGLAGWPMLYGVAAMALLWAATRLFAIWPSGFDI